MHLISTDDDVQMGLCALISIDPWLEAIVAQSGPISLRHVEPGFAGVAHIIVSQLVSRASANAIWARMCPNGSPLTAEEYLALPDDCWQTFGLSRTKAGTLTRIAEAATTGELDLLNDWRTASQRGAVDIDGL